MRIYANIDRLFFVLAQERPQAWHHRGRGRTLKYFTAFASIVQHLQVLFSMHTYYAASTNIVHDIPHPLAPVTLHPAPLGARDTVMPQRLAPVILFTSTVGAVTPYTSTFGARDTLYLNYSCP